MADYVDRKFHKLFLWPCHEMPPLSGRLKQKDLRPRGMDSGAGNGESCFCGTATGQQPRDSSPETTGCHGSAGHEECTYSNTVGAENGVESRLHATYFRQNLNTDLSVQLCIIEKSSVFKCR